MASPAPQQGIPGVHHLFLQGLEAGDYVLVTKLRDRNSAKAGSFELPFTVASTTP